jgi:hypothetical protein
MAIFAAVRRSRTLRKCDTCGGKIQPGERYQHTAISPGHDDYDNTRWLRYRTHLSPMTCYDETRYSPTPEAPDELTVTARED